MVGNFCCPGLGCLPGRRRGGDGGEGKTGERGGATYEANVRLGNLRNSFAFARCGGQLSLREGCVSRHDDNWVSFGCRSFDRMDYSQQTFDGCCAFLTSPAVKCRLPMRWMLQSELLNFICSFASCEVWPPALTLFILLQPVHQNGYSLCSEGEEYRYTD